MPYDGTTCSCVLASRRNARSFDFLQEKCKFEVCTHWGPQEEPIKIYFSLKFSALKHLASPTFGIHKSDQFSLADQVQEMSELRPTFNNSIESNFIHFYISMPFYFFLFHFYFLIFLFFFQKSMCFPLEALHVLLLGSELVALWDCCSTVIWRQ